MTLQEVMHRDWDICHAEERESIALKLDRNGTLSRARRKDWHCNFDGLNTTRRESVWQSAWEVIGGILFLALLAGFVWLMCAMSGYHWE